MAKAATRKKRSARKLKKRKTPRAVNILGLGDITKALEAILNQFGVSLKNERFFTVYDKDPGISTYPSLAVARRGDKFHFKNLSKKEVGLNSGIFETLDGKEPPPLPKFDPKTEPAEIVVRVKAQPGEFHGSPVKSLGAITPSAILGNPEIIILP